MHAMHMHARLDEAIYRDKNKNAVQAVVRADLLDARRVKPPRT